MVLLFISPFGFLTQGPLKILVNTKFHVNFTKIYLPEETLREKITLRKGHITL